MESWNWHEKPEFVQRIKSAFLLPKLCSWLAWLETLLVTWYKYGYETFDNHICSIIFL